MNVADASGVPVPSCSVADDFDHAFGDETRPGWPPCSSTAKTAPAGHCPPPLARSGRGEQPAGRLPIRRRSCGGSDLTAGGAVGDSKWGEGRCRNADGVCGTFALPPTLA